MSLVILGPLAPFSPRLKVPYPALVLLTGWTLVSVRGRSLLFAFVRPSVSAFVAVVHGLDRVKRD
ncbi:hypothetical protein [Natrialba sp. PRR66]|uniref:hypothetical protein n=1 Tax=Natrialba sp. PRR66 TaxID=3098146 RepID=UPI002B1E60EE|nr:hypothetical protein [Natrialba sp. PRR66]